MNVSAFIRSYRNDFDWLRYCLHSLHKRGQQFCEIVIAVPKEDYDLALSSLPVNSKSGNVSVKVLGVNQYGSRPYLSQQADKCLADQYCKGDFIIFIDSDCIATEEIEIADFFTANLPKLLFRKWVDAGDAQCWFPVTGEVLKREPTFETMCSLPIIYHRSTLELFRRHIEHIHQKDFVTWFRGLQHFSEFNAVGNFAHLYTPDAYHFVRAVGPGADGYPRPLKQSWSHGKLDHDEMERILK